MRASSSAGSPPLNYATSGNLGVVFLALDKKCSPRATEVAAAAPRRKGLSQSSFLHIDYDLWAPRINRE